MNTERAIQIEYRECIERILFWKRCWKRLQFHKLQRNRKLDWHNFLNYSIAFSGRRTAVTTKMHMNINIHPGVSNRLFEIILYTQSINLFLHIFSLTGLLLFSYGHHYFMFNPILRGTHPSSYWEYIFIFFIISIYFTNNFTNYSVHSRANKTKILEILRDTWASDRKAEWSIWMVYSKVEMPNQYISSDIDGASQQALRRKALVLRKLNEDPTQAAATRAELHRRSIAQMRINNRSIQDMHIFGDPSRVPIIIVERVANAPRRTASGDSFFSYLDQKHTHGMQSETGSKSIKKLSGTAHRSSRSLKIVIFVHGFQGHHLDLRLVRNQWLLMDPKIEFLMSEANEEKTSGDFREMGLRLAQEVVSFVKKKMDKASRSGVLSNIKISFVGHSIGNVILRTALAEDIMEPYLRYLYTYVSISGPHLGYLYSSNSLFNSGLWLLKKLKGTQVIHQLTFSDDADLRNTFFYNLSKQKTLDKFKNIILMSSPQDGYVPYHSARMEMCQASSGDYSKKGKVFLEMLNNCLDQIRAPSSEQRVFMRCDVNFDISLQGRNLNTLIGRAAHIEFLETDSFARFIMWSFPELF